jgi:hypothetical protein
MPRFRTGPREIASHSAKRTLRVISKRDDDADQPPVLVVEEA